MRLHGAQGEWVGGGTFISLLAPVLCTTMPKEAIRCPLGWSLLVCCVAQGMQLSQDSLLNTLRVYP
jgi:hypothetical protein